MIPYKGLTVRTAIQLAAPHTWVASVYPALFGVLFSRISGYGLHITTGGMLILACILMQAAVNTLNDYADYVKGTDSTQDNVEKSDAVLLYNDIKPVHALYLGLLYLAAGAVLGIFSCIKTGFVPLCIGAVGGVVVLLYSGGRLPLSYRPVGEFISGFVMGGLIPLGIAAAADNRLHPTILVYSLPLIIGIALIMMSNNGCDIEKDIRAGRHTLPVCIGRKKTVILYRISVIVWITLLCVLPVATFGIANGIIAPICIAVGWRAFIGLLKSDLCPEKRVRCMKGIVSANIYGNGGYIAAAAVSLVLGKR